MMLSVPNRDCQLESFHVLKIVLIKYGRVSLPYQTLTLFNYHILSVAWRRALDMAKQITAATLAWELYTESRG